MGSRAGSFLFYKTVLLYNRLAFTPVYRTRSTRLIGMIATGSRNSFLEKCKYSTSMLYMKFVTSCQKTPAVSLRSSSRHWMHTCRDMPCQNKQHPVRPSSADPGHAAGAGVPGVPHVDRDGISAEVGPEGVCASHPCGAACRSCGDGWWPRMKCSQLGCRSHPRSIFPSSRRRALANHRPATGADTCPAPWTPAASPSLTTSTAPAAPAVAAGNTAS